MLLAFGSQFPGDSNARLLTGGLAQYRLTDKLSSASRLSASVPAGRTTPSSSFYLHLLYIYRQRFGADRTQKSGTDAKPSSVGSHAESPSVIRFVAERFTGGHIHFVWHRRFELYYGLLKKFSGDKSVNELELACGFEKVALFLFCFWWHSLPVDTFILIQWKRLEHLFQFSIFHSVDTAHWWTQTLWFSLVGTTLLFIFRLASSDTWAFEKVCFCCF